MKVGKEKKCGVLQVVESFQRRRAAMDMAAGELESLR